MPRTGRTDVVVVGSGFGGSTAALRLTEKGYRVAVLEAGHRFTATTTSPARLLGLAATSGAQARVLRCPAHPPAARRRVLAGAGRRRIAQLREHAVQAAERLLPGPAVGRHHRLGDRARPLVRAGEPDARREAERTTTTRGRRDPRSSRADGRRRHVHLDAGRRLYGEPGVTVPDPYLHGPDEGSPSWPCMTGCHVETTPATHCRRTGAPRWAARRTSLRRLTLTPDAFGGDPEPQPDLLYWCRNLGGRWFRTRGGSSPSFERRPPLVPLHG